MIKWIVILLGLIQCSLCAQQDSVIHMETIGPEVSINGVISTSTKLPARSSEHSIADLLSRHSGIQIQTQGGPYLRTALYRGQSARHMAILWEGVNIQNSFNGTYDLGLISSRIFGQSKWYDGGQSANIGTAAMSGALVLEEGNNDPLISLGLRYNDQDNRSLNLGIQHGVDRFSHSLQANVLINKNAFRFLSRDTVLKRTNSNHNQLDLAYRADMEWSDSMRTHISYWFQDVDRQLAPSIIATNIASQEDRNHRLSIGHDWQWAPNLYWSTKLAYMNEYIGYMQPGIESLAESDIVNLNSKIRIEGTIDHTIGLTYRYEDGALVDTINASFQSFFPKRTTAAVYYNGIAKKDKTTLSISLRQEWIDNNIQTPTGQLSLRYDYSSQLNFTLNAGRHYSYPGFNDLYWPIGGNPDLITEKSWQIEGGIGFSGLIIKLYQIYTADKILWAPNEQSIWTPDNVASTKSSGFEFKYNQKINIGKDFGLTLIPIFNYNHTINTAEGPNEGNELLYNPKLNLRFNTVIKYKQLSLSMDEVFVGRRYQSLDNKSVLDSYNLLNVEINYNWNSKQKYQAEIYFGMRNLVDENYELVRFYPQPLRSIYIGVNFSIQ